MNLQIQQYKNPVTTSQPAKTAYQGWNQAKNKLSSANIATNSAGNFPFESRGS